MDEKKEQTAPAKDDDVALAIAALEKWKTTFIHNSVASRNTIIFNEIQSHIGAIRSALENLKGE